MITVKFYKWENECMVYGIDEKSILIEIHTNKNTIDEAFEVAVSNGANPLNTIQYEFKNEIL